MKEEKPKGYGDGWTKPNKVYFIPTQILIQVPHCPKCKKPISEVTDIDAKTIMTWYCNNCHYSE